MLTGTTQTVHVSLDGGIMRMPSTVQLQILDTSDLYQAPTIIDVVVAGCDEDAELVFDIDGTDVWTDQADPDGILEETSIPCPALSEGTHTLTVTSNTNGSDSVEFTLLAPPEVLPSIVSEDDAPTYVEDAVNKWVFQDPMPDGLGSWVLPINPDTMSSPHFERHVTVRHTTAVDSGQFHIAESGAQWKTWRISGYCPDKEFYDNLVAYADLNRKIWIIDHRQRAWMVVVTGLTMEPRKRQSDEVSADNDWSGRWEMTLTILDQATIQLEAE